MMMTMMCCCQQRLAVFWGSDEFAGKRVDFEHHFSAQCVSSIGQIIKSVCVSVSEWVSEWVCQSVNFESPSISQERLKLETSNLACRLATGGSKQNNAKLGQKGSIRGHVTDFSKFRDPLHISGTVEARNIKFGMQIGHGRN